MQAWLIIVISILVGVALFGGIFYFQTKKKKQRALRNQPVVMVSNSNNMPMAAPIFNASNPSQMYQQSTVNTGQGYYNPGQTTGQGYYNPGQTTGFNNPAQITGQYVYPPQQPRQTGRQRNPNSPTHDRFEPTMHYI